MRYLCCDERRREGVRAAGVNNGIEYLEVVDSAATDPAMRQRKLEVHLLNNAGGPLAAITKRDVHIEGGTRVTGIRVTQVKVDGALITVTVDRPGDYSLYTLRLGDVGEHEALGLDAQLASVDFSFKVECPTDFDCADGRSCPPVLLEEPAIDYLARDYASFRQVMLDRLAVVLPDWRERNAADLGVALVEVLAYTADHLSYQLDAIGMEATLATARHRVSAKRHARLVDYTMHDGANARAWVQVVVEGTNVEVPKGTPLLSRVPGIDERIPEDSDLERRALESRPVVFETMHKATLHDDLNELHFHTWGDSDCCLPAGATSATLFEHHPHLEKGMVLVFEERLDPRTGLKADADPSHRHAVRLSEDPKPGTDPIGTWFDDKNAPAGPVPITEIFWAAEDALPFPLCISATDVDENISVALGNIVLADHGRTIERDLPVVPQPDRRLAVVPAGTGDRCDPVQSIDRPARYGPVLEEAPLTMAGTTGRVRRDALRDDDRRWESFDASGSASAAMRWDDRHVVPAISLHEKERGRTCEEKIPNRTWYPRLDLLGSDAFRREFVAEVDDVGRATLRFGDDTFGMRPAAGTELCATYRVGNGPAGNVGAGALHHIVIDDGRVTSVRNPMPAQGGVAPESIEHVRRIAPSAFRVNQRAVTPDDYAEVAERHRQVQRAQATERWTGSWHTVFLSIDRTGGLPVDDAFERELRDHLERYRMAGHDVEIDGPRFVWLELELRVCVLPAYYRGDVRRDLLEVFGTRTQAGGRPGFFHPDNFTFGQSVYLSRIYAAAQAVPGVRMVEATVFRRLGEQKSHAIETGELTIDSLEVARLDNDPSFPDRGVIRLEMEGGQ